jgi:hypothetical protein
MARQSSIRDKTDRKYYSQIPHLIDDLPIHVASKALWIHLKRIAGECECAPEEHQDKLTTAALATHLGISTGLVSRAKAELEAFGLITIVATAGMRDHIEIEDIWPRNIAHMAGARDPMIACPPGGNRSNSERLQGGTVQIVNGNRSNSERSVVVNDSGDHIKGKPVLLTVVVEPCDPAAPDTPDAPVAPEPDPANPAAPDTPDAPVAPEPDPANPAAAPNAPVKRRRSKAPKPGPVTSSEDPRAEDPRILAFTALFASERDLWLNDIDAICKGVPVDQLDGWRQSLQEWADKRYRVDRRGEFDSVVNLVQYHRRTRGRVTTNAATPPADTPAASPASLRRIAELKAAAAARRAAREGVPA